ncbi:hypothetical protein J6590_080051 [Homalodisca vitripennis]|nr:hypothetical protein J6590_080051 [Homalodisca vitripennis]
MARCVYHVTCPASRDHVSASENGTHVRGLTSGGRKCLRERRTIAESQQSKVRFLRNTNS